MRILLFAYVHGDVNAWRITRILDRFDSCWGIEQMAGMLCMMLDGIDTLIRKNETIRARITPKIAESMTHLSVVAECLRQISLWMATAPFQAVGEDHKGCKDLLRYHGFKEFIIHQSFSTFPRLLFTTWSREANLTQYQRATIR
ncbi:hypothetical protein K458DRAFT_385702 [Lentithecium fluviatile CBS 122367]|uniref:Uncharacterized protein n=1 Tax=Lentithecium fluviatile CBS 122367 TaxID=1168545 RepID=A0A6G1JC41_9PLEO|nr:hypothetical protein K458DRAFT_385702 [Lentithecium fluviatile CBS 122367]